MVEVRIITIIVDKLFRIVLEEAGQAVGQMNRVEPDKPISMQLQ